MNTTAARGSVQRVKTGSGAGRPGRRDSGAAREAQWQFARSSPGTALLEAHPENKDVQSVRLSYYNPTAGEVSVAGVFNDWRPNVNRMLRQRDGTWIADLILSPGCYEYRLYVDGQWRDDPTAAAVAPNGFGGVNAVLRVDRI